MSTDLSRLDQLYGNNRSSGYRLIIKIPKNSIDIYNLLLRAQYVSNKPSLIVNSYNFLKLNSSFDTLEIWDHAIVPWMHSSHVIESSPELIEDFMSVPIPSQFVMSRKWYFDMKWCSIGLLILLAYSIIFSTGILSTLIGVAVIIALYYSVWYYQYRDFKSKSALMIKQYHRVRMLYYVSVDNGRFTCNIPDMLYIMNGDVDTNAPT